MIWIRKGALVRRQGSHCWSHFPALRYDGKNDCVNVNFVWRDGNDPEREDTKSMDTSREQVRALQHSHIYVCFAARVALSSWMDGSGFSHRGWEKALSGA